MRRLQSFGLTLLLASTCNAIPKLQDVFHVDARNPAQYHSSCMPYLGRTQTADATSTKPLNQIWQQIHDMNHRVIRAIARPEYNKPANQETRELARAFFAIKENSGPNGNTRYEYPESQSLQEPMISYRRKLKTVRENYQTLDTILKKVQPDTSLDKPRLYCDSTFMEIQTANSNALDAEGKPIPVRVKNKIVGYKKLKDYVNKKWGEKTFDENWFLWSDDGDDRGYIVLSKKSFPAVSDTTSPFHQDSRTHKPSYCAGTASNGKIMGTTLIGVEKPELGDESDNDDDDGFEDEAPWITTEQVILCPRSFSSGDIKLPSTRPKDGTPLDRLELTALTFFHELFHITDYHNEDQDKRGPRDGNTMDHKDDFVVQKEQPTTGPVECILLANWELAHEETISAESLATKNCESYAWFGFAVLVQETFQMDCANGKCYTMHGAG